MKKKVRIAFILFTLISFSILFLYNQSQDQTDIYQQIAGDALIQKAISDRIAIIIYIFAMVTVCILYLVYEFYRVMYHELADRMELLDASRNDLQTAYDSVAMFFIEIDDQMTIININNAFSEYIGRMKNSIIGQRLQSVLDFRENSISVITAKIRESFERNRSERTEIDEAGKVYEAFIYPMNAATDRSKRALLILNNVTTLRATERQMLQDNKMIAVGQLAAGVAHEIRNPLGIIRNYCYILKNSSEYDRAIIEKAIVSIEKAVDKSGRIIDNLLDFSRISSNVRETVNLSKFLQAIIALEQNVLDRKNVRAAVDCDEDIEMVTAAEALEIILINLIINASDAMPQGGDIEICATQNEDTIQILVSDTGTGIPEDNLGSIFNPFFTTKEKRDGSGLGLYIVYNETEKLGGKIEVESKPGKGTVFTLTFPQQRSEENEQ